MTSLQLVKQLTGRDSLGTSFVRIGSDVTR